MAELSGRLLHRGAPVAGAQVLAVDEVAGVVVADAETGPDGSWRLPAASLIFARCDGDVLGVAVGRPGEEDLEITDVAPTHELTIRLVGVPAGLTPRVRLTPLAIGTLDPAMLRWVHAPVREMASSVLAEIAVTGGELQRLAQQGRWWLGAGLELVADARAAGAPDGVRYRADRAETADGRALVALKGGFELDITGPVTVTVTLSAAP